MTQEMASTTPLYVHSDYIWATDELYHTLSPEHRQHTHEVNTVSNRCVMDIKADVEKSWPYPYISNTNLQVWPHKADQAPQSCYRQDEAASENAAKQDTAPLRQWAQRCVSLGMWV